MDKFLVIVIFCILLNAVFIECLKKFAQEFFEFSEQCMIEEGGTKADFDALIHKQAAPSREAKCMRACLMKKYKLIDETDVFDKAAALEHYVSLAQGDAERLRRNIAIYEKCLETVYISQDRCELGELYSNCLNEQRKLYGLGGIH